MYVVSHILSHIIVHDETNIEQWFFVQETQERPKSFIGIPSDYESDGEEAFPELEISVSINVISSQKLMTLAF